MMPRSGKARLAVCVDEEKKKDVCCICTHSMDGGHALSVSTCGHTFHQKCIMKWLHGQREARRKAGEMVPCGTCPTCRENVYL